MVPEDAPGAVLPPLPLDAWEDTKETLHRYAQVVGKIRLTNAPFKNHWWHVTLYVDARGLTTGPIPYGRTNFEISLNLMDNRLEARAGDGGAFGFALDDLAVADFYRKLVDGLAAIGVEVSIDPRPFDLGDEQPLDRNYFHRTCDPEYVRRYGQILVWVSGVFEAFAGRFNGKQSPVHLFWHSFDLALARFSQRRAPERDGADPVTREAYSHEVISFGFWPGDREVREPTFYSYTAPEPPGLTDQPLEPQAARWLPEGGTASLSYEDVRLGESPEGTLLLFLQSAYQAGARTANWDEEALRTSSARSPEEA
jgi:uncharacterized protein DUF5996